MSWAIFIPIVVVSLCAIGAEIVVAMRDHPEARSPGLVALFGIVAFPVAIVVHNALSAFIGDEEAVSFILALVVAPAATTIGTLAVAAALVGVRSASLLVLALGMAGAGLAVFAGYAVFALVVTSLAHGIPSYMPAAEGVLLPLAAGAVAGGALIGIPALARDHVTTQRRG